MELHSHHLVIIILGGLFFASAIYALWWCTRAGHFKELELTAKSIFTDEEPEGIQTDFFPGEAKNYPIKKCK